MYIDVHIYIYTGMYTHTHTPMNMQLLLYLYTYLSNYLSIHSTHTHKYTYIHDTHTHNSIYSFTSISLCLPLYLVSFLFFFFLKKYPRRTRGILSDRDEGFVVENHLAKFSLTHSLGNSFFRDTQHSVGISWT